MNHTYQSKCEVKGRDNGIDHMIVAFYRDETLVSRERVTRDPETGGWNYCMDVFEGQYTAFDVMAGIAGLNNAFNDADALCYEASWECPGELIDILCYYENTFSKELLQQRKEAVSANINSYNFPVTPAIH